MLQYGVELVPKPRHIGCRKLTNSAVLARFARVGLTSWNKFATEISSDVVCASRLSNPASQTRGGLLEVYSRDSRAGALTSIVST